MGIRKVLARAGVAACAALPLWMSALPASADSHQKFDTFEQTIIDRAGQPVLCEVVFGERLDRAGLSGPYHAEGSTTAGIGPDESVTPEQCKADVGVNIAYRDVGGRELHAQASGLMRTDLLLDEVAGNIVVTHTVSFLNCRAQCDARFVSSPK